MTRHKTPVTPAVRVLRSERVPFEEHPYPYEEKGGTAVFAREAGVNENRVIKTLVMEDEAARPMIVLMHGELEVSAKALARQIGCKWIKPCDPATAQRHSGYKVGGTSPFGTRKSMTVYCEETIMGLPLIYINGGSRGYGLSMAPGDMARVLRPTLVSVAR